MPGRALVSGGSRRTGGLAACLAAALALAVGVLAGCGGSGGGGGSSDVPASGPGKVFADTCGGCHTLAAAGTSGSVGPNLDDLQPSKQLVLHTIATGPSVMPSDLLTGKQADQVAAWVAAHAGR